ncbi:uncharacterized protein GIQ15_04441 [Arthroderma uncinatum]|uniref:uncharacterized protein n=1 Tax=Arthroderma uncinatum TaxID=74035 RepID=UPI00144AE789|nr:uncharacterized protein GIQ15_04441 [Arthroderma uncinatum]KAF3481682.1 hypothetical protein GIQ15_04441 [Arthroderma uncinatum]
MKTIGSILQPISDQSPPVQKKLKERLLGKSPARHFNGEPFACPSLDPYFKYYAEQCSLALFDGATSSTTHQDVLDMIDLLRTPITREELKQRICRHPSSSNATTDQDPLIHLAARSILMINLGDFRGTIANRSQLTWEDGCLKSCVQKHFHQPALRSYDSVKLEKSFTARNLSSIGGLRVSFTSNLADHLRLTHDDQVVEIFHQVSFLEYQRGSSLYPDGLVDETFRTLALLFPQSDWSMRRWLRKTCSSQNAVVDERVLRCGWCRTEDRQIQNFHFWHDRLVMLKQLYDEARPGTVSQWWHDRRNGVQWYTFWVAVLVLLLTVFFGLVQSIEGALQVYKAYHPTKT